MELNMKVTGCFTEQIHTWPFKDCVLFDFRLVTVYRANILSLNTEGPNRVCSLQLLCV